MNRPELITALKALLHADLEARGKTLSDLSTEKDIYPVSRRTIYKEKWTDETIRVMAEALGVRVEVKYEIQK